MVLGVFQYEWKTIFMFGCFYSVDVFLFLGGFFVSYSYTVFIIKNKYKIFALENTVLMPKL